MQSSELLPQTKLAYQDAVPLGIGGRKQDFSNTQSGSNYSNNGETHLEFTAPSDGIAYILLGGNVGNIRRDGTHMSQRFVFVNGVSLGYSRLASTVNPTYSDSLDLTTVHLSKGDVLTLAADKNGSWNRLDYRFVPFSTIDGVMNFQPISVNYFIRAR